MKLFANKIQLESLASGKPITGITLLKEQPPKGYEYTIIFENEAVFILMPCGSFKGTLNIPLLHPIGTVLDVKETWACGFDENGIRQKPEIYSYKADLSKEELELFRIFSGNKWHSPVTMPKEAVRHHLIVTRCEVKRVSELTYFETKELLQEGFDTFGYDNADKRLAKYWNDLHSKPVRYKDGWKCYPYDWQSFHELYGDDERWGYFDYNAVLADPHGSIITVYAWEDKPLTIHPDPFIEVWEAEATK